MKVYIVTYESISHFYSYPDVEAVFSTEDAAIKYIQKYERSHFGSYDIIEKEVDNEDFS